LFLHDLTTIAPFFAGIPGDAMRELAESCETTQFGSGELVYQQGNPGDTGLLLLDGLLEVSVETERQVRHLGLIHPGEIVGEQCLFMDGIHRSATVQANKASTALVLAPTILADLSHNPAIAVLELHLLATLGRRVRQTNLLIQKAWKVSPQAPESLPAAGFSQRLRSLFGSKG